MAEITPQQSIGRAELPVELPTLELIEPLEDGVDDGRLRTWLDAFRRRFIVHTRELRKRLDEVIYGKVNWMGDFTLTDGGATTTVVSDDRVTSDCEISLHPLTANAASILGKVFVRLADLAPGTAWAASPVGQFTVQHPILAAADFSYRYSIKG